MGKAGGATNRIQLIPASDVVGLDIRFEDGKAAGEIEFLMIDSTSSRVRYALIAEDGELELDDDEFVVLPFADLGISRSGEDEFSVRATLAKLSGAKRIQADAVSELTEPVVITEVYDYYPTPEADRIDASGKSGHANSDKDSGKANKNGDGSRAAKKASDTANGGTINSSTANEDSDNEENRGHPHVLVARDFVSTVIPGMRSTDSMVGAEVRISSDEDFGEIDELMLDIAHNRVAYALISHGGFLGIGEEWYAVPLQQLLWTEDDTAYWAMFNAKTVSEMKGIRKTDLPTSVRKKELDEFYQSFGMEPHGAEDKQVS